MRGCDRVPRHDAQALGAFACVSGPVGEARSSVGRSGVTAWSGRPAHALPHAAHCLGHWVQTDEVQRAKEWQIRLESENHAVSRQAEAQVLTSPPPSTPSPFLACPSLRSVAAVPDVLKARKQPTPAHTHARTHARGVAAVAEAHGARAARAGNAAGATAAEISPLACVPQPPLTACAARWCQHAARLTCCAGRRGGRAARAQAARAAGREPRRAAALAQPHDRPRSEAGWSAHSKRRTHGRAQPRRHRARRTPECAALR